MSASSFPVRGEIQHLDSAATTGLYCADEEPIILTRRESLRLLELLENPPPRTEKFLRAMSDYEKMKSDDGDSSIDWSPR